MRLVLGRAGLADNGKRLTPEIIQEVVETFAEVKEAPVTIGHTYADYMPAFGWVKKVWTNGDNNLLLGEVELIPPLKEFFQQGYFRKWSVGIRKRPKDGKHYLHHLAFLGAVPPAIKGLSVIKMSEEGETERYEFSDKANPKEEEEMKELEALKKENTALKAKIEELEKKLSERKSERKEFAELKDELKLLQTKFAETARQLKQERLQRLRAAAEGKLPKDALEKLLVFAERLPEEPLVFAEGEKKEKKDPLEWLAGNFVALPKPVAEGALQMGDVKDKEEFDPAKMAQIL